MSVPTGRKESREPEADKSLPKGTKKMDTTTKRVRALIQWANAAESPSPSIDITDEVSSTDTSSYYSTNHASTEVAPVFKHSIAMHACKKIVGEAQGPFYYLPAMLSGGRERERERWVDKTSMYMDIKEAGKQQN